MKKLLFLILIISFPLVKGMAIDSSCFRLLMSLIHIVFSKKISKIFVYSEIVIYSSCFRGQEMVEEGMSGQAFNHKSAVNFLKLVMVNHDLAVAEVVGQVSNKILKDISVAVISQLAQRNPNRIVSFIFNKGPTPFKGVDIPHGPEKGRRVFRADAILIGVFGDIITQIIEIIDDKCLTLNGFKGVPADKVIAHAQEVSLVHGNNYWELRYF